MEWAREEESWKADVAVGVGGAVTTKWIGVASPTTASELTVPSDTAANRSADAPVAFASFSGNVTVSYLTLHENNIKATYNHVNRNVHKTYKKRERERERELWRQVHTT